jgi:capsular polysaccharide biosynthesis protein
MEENITEVDIKDYLQILIKRKWLIIAFILFSMIIALIISLLTKPLYKASAVVYLGDATQRYISASSVNSVIKSDDFLKGVISSLNFDISLETLRGNIAVNYPPQSKTITIEVSSFQPRKAADIANTIATNFVREIGESEKEKLMLFQKANLQKELKRIKDEIEEVKEKRLKYEKVNVEGGNSESLSKVLLLGQLEGQERSLKQFRFQILEKIYQIEQALITMEKPKTLSMATVPSTPFKPKTKLNLILAGFLSLFLGIFLAFVLESLKR